MSKVLGIISCGILAVMVVKNASSDAMKYVGVGGAVIVGGIVVMGGRQ